MVIYGNRDSCRRRQKRRTRITRAVRRVECVVFAVGISTIVMAECDKVDDWKKMVVGSDKVPMECRGALLPEKIRLYVRDF